MTPLQLANEVNEQIAWDNPLGAAKLLAKEVILLTEENKDLKVNVRAKGVACLTGDHDLVGGFACLRCYGELEEAIREAQERFRIIETTQVPEDDWTEELQICLENAREWLSKYGGEK